MNNSHEKPITEEPEADAFARSLATLMPRLLHATLRKERNALARGVLTFPQVMVLDDLIKNGPCPMHLLAERLHLTPSHATGLMDRLVAMKMARRYRGPRDRRVVLADISPRGQRAIEGIGAEKQALWYALYRRLSPGMRRAFLSALHHLLDEIEQLEPMPVTGGRKKP